MSVAAVAPRGKTTSDCSRSSRINNCSDDWRAIRFILGGFANWRFVFGVMILLVITMLGMMKFVPHVALSTEASVKKN